MKKKHAIAFKSNVDETHVKEKIYLIYNLFLKINFLWELIILFNVLFTIL